MQHADIWRALDALAASHRLTASGLARAAGLDPTTFNRSKRISPDGKERWPSSESVTRALHAVGADYEDFAALMAGRLAAPARMIPFVTVSCRAHVRWDGAGMPVGASHALPFPDSDGTGAFAVEIADADAEPVFRGGDIVIARPGVEIRRNDRVVVALRDGAWRARRVGARTNRSIDLAPLDPTRPFERVARADITGMARIVWASQ